jgi:hypothetical protein
LGATWPWPCDMIKSQRAGGDWTEHLSRRVDARPRLQTSSGTTDRRGSQSPTGTCNWRASCISDFPHPGIAIPGSRSCSKLGGSNLRRHETAVRTLSSVPSSKLSFTLFFRSGSSCLTRAPVSNFLQMILLPMHWSTGLEGVKFDPDGVFRLGDRRRER